MKSITIYLRALCTAGLFLGRAAWYAQAGGAGTTDPGAGNVQRSFGRAMHGAMGPGVNFIDENGNGISDRLEDADGDGVINALDPDSKYYRQPGSAQAGFGMGLGFTDEDGDGINDHL